MYGGTILTCKSRREVRAAAENLPIWQVRAREDGDAQGNSISSQSSRGREDNRFDTRRTCYGIGSGTVQSGVVRGFSGKRGQGMHYSAREFGE